MHANSHVTLLIYLCVCGYDQPCWRFALSECSPERAVFLRGHCNHPEIAAAGKQRNVTSSYYLLKLCRNLTRFICACAG